MAFFEDKRTAVIAKYYVTVCSTCTELGGEGRAYPLLQTPHLVPTILFMAVQRHPIHLTPLGMIRQQLPEQSSHDCNINWLTGSFPQLLQIGRVRFGTSRSSKHRQQQVFCKSSRSTAAAAAAAGGGGVVVRVARFSAAAAAAAGDGVWLLLLLLLLVVGVAPLSAAAGDETWLLLLLLVPPAAGLWLLVLLLPANCCCDVLLLLSATCCEVGVPLLEPKGATCPASAWLDLKV
jgi:hypothetical protein